MEKVHGGVKAYIRTVEWITEIWKSNFMDPGWVGVLGYRICLIKEKMEDKEEENGFDILDLEIAVGEMKITELWNMMK